MNSGAMVAPLVCGYLGQRIDYHLGFAAAGIGMALGLIQYVAHRKRLAGVLFRLFGITAIVALLGSAALGVMVPMINRLAASGQEKE
ncbi:MAG: hypothetical protein AB1631_04355 [Acidobacteriota bacterium]